MATEEETTTSHRLRARKARNTDSLLEKDKKDASLGQRHNSSSKRKAEVTLESLYLQKNYKDPSSTPLETIFESPRPSRGINQGQAAPDAPLLMANRKLKRLCIFPSHHQLPRNKLKQRKERALKMKRLTGVQVPLGKAFSEDDVHAVLSCLGEEETATSSAYQDHKREILDLPNNTTDLVKGMISVLNSFQMECEPSFEVLNQPHLEASPTEFQLSKEKKERNRCDLIPKTLDSPSASTSTQHSPTRRQPPKTVSKVKKLKRRSGLVFPQKSSSPTSFSDFESVINIHPHQFCPTKAGMAKDLDQDILTEMKEHTMSRKLPCLKSGSKRTPDSTCITSTKKHCTRKIYVETNTDPSSCQQSKTQGKNEESIGAKMKLHSSYIEKIPSNNISSNNIVLSEQDAASPILQLSFLPLSPPLQALSHRDISPLPNSLGTGDGTTDDEDGGERGVRKEGTSPSSPSARMAALSLQSSPTHLCSLVKPKKIRRRSARLSIGSDIIERVHRIEGNESRSSSVIPLGTLWTAISPQEQKAKVSKAANSIKVENDDDLMPL